MQWLLVGWAGESYCIGGSVSYQNSQALGVQRWRCRGMALQGSTKGRDSSEGIGGGATLGASLILIRDLILG